MQNNTHYNNYKLSHNNSRMTAIVFIENIENFIKNHYNHYVIIHDISLKGKKNYS